MVPSYDINKTIKYSLKNDIDDVKTVFQIGVLDAKAQAFLNTEFTTVQMKGNGRRNSENNPDMEPVISINRDGKDIETVALCLKSVTNFSGVISFTEKTYTFGKRSVLTDAALNLIKPYVPELADAIREASEFTADVEKN